MANIYDDATLNFINNTAEDERLLQTFLDDPEYLNGDDDGFNFTTTPPPLYEMFFFLFWNTFCGAHVTLCLSYLIRAKFHSSLRVMICPHWLIGIIIPTVLGYQQSGISGLLLLFFV